MVVKVESAARPDPTPLHTPALDARLNGAKRRICTDLAGSELRAQIAGARVLITSARPHALARLGLDSRVQIAAWAIAHGLVGTAIC